MPGDITVEATLDVFTGEPLVVVTTVSDERNFTTVANLSPEEADEVARLLIVCAADARKK